MFGSPRAMQSITRAQSIETYLSFSNLSFNAVLLCSCSQQFLAWPLGVQTPHLFPMDSIISYAIMTSQSFITEIVQNRTKYYVYIYIYIYIYWKQEENYSFFPTSNIYITLYFNVSSTLLRKNRNTDFLYICILRFRTSSE